MGMGKRRAGALVASTLAVVAVGGGLAAAWPGGSSTSGPAGGRAASGDVDVTLTGHVPLTVASGTATLLRTHPAKAEDPPELRVPDPRQGRARAAHRTAVEDGHRT